MESSPLFACSRVQGFSGDGGPATSATLAGPWGIAVDGSGNLFIADTQNSPVTHYGNNRVRRVSTNGTITTVAGNGFGSLSGDGGLATSAQLSGPEGVAVDGIGNLLTPAAATTL